MKNRFILALKNVLLIATLFFATKAVAQLPTITSFTPTSGSIGSLVTITGTNLSTPTALSIGGVSAIAVSRTATNIVAMVMPGAANGTISVTTAGGSATSSSSFSVIASVPPAAQQGNKLVGTGNEGSNSEQGYSISISADGNTAIVGGYTDNSSQGAVWIYTRSGGVWSQQGNKLVGTGNVGTALQGNSVSLSADGNTAIVGGYFDNSQQGAAWIFTRSGGVWSQQGNKLVGTGNIGVAQQGFSVSISADGNTAIVGGKDDNSQQGAAWIFTRSGSTWSQVGSKLVGTGSIGAAQQGNSVSLSADGNTAIVGGVLDNSNQGAVWIFARSGNVWSQQGDKLVGTGNVGAGRQGASVSLSADGNTAIVGGALDNSNQGAVWIYTRSGSVWSQQGNKLVGTGNVGAARQGSSVSLSADGNTAIVGGPGDNNNYGAAWVYTRSGGVWSQHDNKRVGVGSLGAVSQCRSVCLSADGNTAMIGASFDNSSLGAVWVFSGLAQPPTISSFSPTSGPIGTLVTIIGTNLATQTSLTIGGVSAIPISNTGTSLVAMVMPGATTGNISVANSSSSATSFSSFTITTNAVPVSQQGDKLVGTGNIGAAQQGTSISISSDGNTAIVGGFKDNSNEGAAWIYTRSGGVWSQQGNKLVGTGNVGAAQQGYSVGISADGNTAIVGGILDNSSQGAAWIFTRSGEVWTQQGNKLVGTGNSGAAQQGYSVSLSADGNTAIVGGIADFVNNGAAWVFNRISGVWRQQGSPLRGSGNTGAARRGSSVSLSADGNTAIIGGYSDNSNQGTAWIYIRSGGGWFQQGSKLVGTGNSGSAQQGRSVSISADGNTAIIGGSSDNSSQGAVWIFTRSGTTWNQQGNKLVGTSNIGASQQGCSVNLSADGNTAIVGGSADNGNIGSIWVYTRSGSVWSQYGSRFIGSGNIGNASQGVSVCLSADGNTAMIGGNTDDSNQGAAWVCFGNPPAPTITSFSPSSGAIGTLITITGSNLGTLSTLTIGGVNAIAISNNGTNLVAMVMPGTATGAINITTVGGTSISGSNFTVTANIPIGVQQGNKLVGTGNTGAANQGYSVSVSADGNTAIVGGYSDNTNQGAAWIYIRSGGVWSQQGSKLVGTGNSGAAQQGFSVGISADGNTAIVGGFADNNNTGAAWIFTRNGVTWSQQGNKLVGTGVVMTLAQQGRSVSISADGNTAIVGGIGDNTNQGAAWIFTRSAGVWSQQGSKLVGTGSTASARQGTSVCLSADGNTAIVGGNADNSNQGAAWVFTRSGNSWSQQGSKLVGTGNTGAAQQGFAVSISADGNTAIVGGNADNTNQGAAWIFTRSGGSWSQQGSKLAGTGNSGAANQGYSVSLSADGNTAMLGGYSDNTNQGATWAFTRSGNVWSQQGNKIIGTGNIGAAVQGVSVCLSADGNTAFIGGNIDNSNQGAAWVYISAPAPTFESFTPASGSIGSLVTISGTNLNTFSTSISIGGVNAIVVSNTGNSLVAMVMPGATTGTIVVNTNSGTATSSGNFTISTNLPIGIQQGSKIVGTGNTSNSSQGRSVSLSADGNTAIVGGHGDNANQGAAWIYTRSGGVWSQQGSKLVGTGVLGVAIQGTSVCISADGNTAIVGGSVDNSSVGAAWIFTRSGGVWTQQGNKLVGSGNTISSQQGTSVSISADGNTVVVGGSGDNVNQGAVWVFTRSGNIWSQQGSKLVGTGNSGAARQGASVSLSADGNTIIVGGIGDNSNQGASWIFVRNGGVWSQQGSKLVGTGNSGAAQQGTSVSLSANGNTAVVGGPSDNSNQGASWVFTRSGSTWSQQGSKLVGIANIGAAQQGRSVSLSADGNTAIVGGNSNNSNNGATWIFARSGSVWGPGLGAKFVIGTGNTGAAQQGFSVSLSAEGNTAIVGGFADNNNIGAAWVFVPSSNNANLSGLSLSSGTLNPSFASGTTSYTANVNNAISSITVTPTEEDTNSILHVRVNGGTYTLVNNGVASGSLSLNEGNNTVDVRVTAQDGTTIKTYTITVTREPLLITWTGAISNVWDIASNWSPTQIPTSANNVIIATSSNNPVLGSGGATVRNVAINSGATLTLAGNLIIRGNLNTQGTLNALSGTLFFNGSVAQTADANGGTVQNLTIDNAAGVTLTGALNLTGVLTPTSGVLTTGGFLTLKSFANSSGSIASNLSGSNYISGNVIVERFISGQSNRGRWRFLSSPVSNATIASWMNQFYVTGPGDSVPANRVNGSTLGTLNTNGWHTNMANISFPNSTMNSNVNSVKTTSVRTYNEAVITGDINSGWENLTSNTQNLTPGRGFRAFIRGDKNAPNSANTQLGLGANSNIQGAVNLTLTGPVNQGEINANPTFTSSGTIGNDGWNLIGNPYPCSYNLFAHINAPSNSSFFANISPTVYVYSAVTGGYVSYNTAGGGVSAGLDNGIIPPGAAFFIKATGANPVFKFQEAYKTTNSHLTGGVHKTEIKTEEFGIKYFKDTTERDYTVIKMYDGATLNNDVYDIVKVRNENLNLSAYGTDSVNLTASVLPPIVEETRIKLNVEASQIGTYNFDFTNMDNFNKGITVNLFDRYTNKTMDVRKNTKYTFEMGPDSNQWGNNRFELILNLDKTNVDEFALLNKTQMLVYPNPATDVLNININNTNFKNSEVVVYNISGAEVLKTNMAVNNAQLNIETLCNGVYFVKVSNENGFNKTVKFVK